MRKVEWTARHDDQKIPFTVMLRVHDKTNGCCAECGIKIAVGRFAIDHIVALCNGGKHAEHNLQLLCLPHHKIKTAADVAERSKVARKRKKHLGITSPKRKIASRGFAKAEPQRTASRPLERRS